LLTGALGWDDFYGNESGVFTKGKLSLVFACLKAAVFEQFEADSEVNYEKPDNVTGIATKF
jgi:hypothetical protein